MWSRVREGEGDIGLTPGDQQGQASIFSMYLLRVCGERDHTHLMGNQTRAEGERG